MACLPHIYSPKEEPAVADKNEDQKDRRPDVAKDEKPAPREDAKEKWHQPEKTLSEGPAPSPNATKRSRVSK